MIDFNCDVGEGLNNEHLLMPYISSCNISCGAHAGSVEIIDKVLGLAVKHNVKIGAHPSFEDRENFGRVVLDISNDELHQSLVNQLLLFQERIKLQSANIHHVKPHGALYNLIAVNREKAEVVVNAIQEVFGNMSIYVPYNSVIADVAKESGLDIVFEAFADRNYNDDLTLVSRIKANATMTDSKAIISHVSSMVNDRKVKTLSGKQIPIEANTFCIHGDNKNVIEILLALNERFLGSARNDNG
jgi:UPF0271 protein